MVHGKKTGDPDILLLRMKDRGLIAIARKKCKLLQEVSVVVVFVLQVSDLYNVSN